MLQQERKKQAAQNRKPVLQHLGKVTIQKSNGKRRNDNRKQTQKANIIENYGKVAKIGK